MASAVQHLGASERPKLAAHFLALPLDDRRLRFGGSISDDSIVRYVDRIAFDRDAVFVVFDDELVLVGAAHVAFADDSAELGISVLPESRGLGAGSALFRRAAAHARNRSASTVFMHCLAENAAIMHIARKVGMTIVAAAGDVDAHLALLPASPFSIAGEFLTDRLALYDYSLKAQGAAWKRICAVLESAQSDRRHECSRHLSTGGPAALGKTLPLTLRR